MAPLHGPGHYRAELNIPQDAVVALDSGSMGVKQGVDWVAEAAEMVMPSMLASGRPVMRMALSVRRSDD